MANLGHKILGIVLCGIKAFFSAVVQVAWGIATFFLLAGLMVYFKQDTSLITTLLKLVLFIQQNWLWFFWAIGIFDFIINLKDFLRPVYSEQQQSTKQKEVKL